VVPCASAGFEWLVRAYFFLDAEKSQPITKRTFRIACRSNCATRVIVC